MAIILERLEQVLDAVRGDEDEYIRGVSYKKHSLKWYELDANKRGYEHFDGLYKSWDSIKYPIKESH